MKINLQINKRSVSIITIQEFPHQELDLMNKEKQLSHIMPVQPGLRSSITSHYSVFIKSGLAKNILK